MLKKPKKILLIYVEPTPYILSLITLLQKEWPDKMDILFLAENVSQQWNMRLSQEFDILPKSRIKKILFLIKTLSKDKYDAIHVAGWGSLLHMYILILAKYNRIAISVESDTPTPHNMGYWKRILKQLLYPRIFNLVDVFLPGGLRQKSYIEYYGVRPHKIFPVQMTVDIKTIQKRASQFLNQDKINARSKYGISENELVFLFVGRLEHYKGLIDLVSAFNLMRAPLTKLVFVGEGSLREYIEQAIVSNHQICYTGRLSGEALIEMYHAADVFILPSHAEPWGLVINEAMAMNLPVIVSDRVGCIDDLVVHMETGLIFPAENVAALQSAMEFMTREAGVRKDMGRKAAEKIAGWTLENEAKKICQAWNQLSYTKEIPA